jgi:hypothetical protein
MEYKIFIGLVLVAATMMAMNTGAVFATDDDMSDQDRYQSGYDHGCSDAQIEDASDRYINQHEKGFSYHTASFNDGYRDGLAACGIDHADSIQNVEQENNQAAYTNQRGSCGVVLIGDCNVGQSSTNKFAAAND